MGRKDQMTPEEALRSLFLFSHGPHSKIHQAATVLQGAVKASKELERLKDAFSKLGTVTLPETSDPALSSHLSFLTDWFQTLFRDQDQKKRQQERKEACPNDCFNCGYALHMGDGVFCPLKRKAVAHDSSCEHWTHGD